MRSFLKRKECMNLCTICIFKKGTVDIKRGKDMNFRVRMKSAMLIIIMLCVLCVNSVLAKVDQETEAKKIEVREHKICYTVHNFAETKLNR